MLTLQKAFSQLCLVVGSAAQNSVKCSQTSAGFFRKPMKQLLPSSESFQTATTVCTQMYSTKTGSKKEDSGKRVSKHEYEYEAPSPYRNPGPRRYGHETRYFTGGLLPRGLDEPVRSMPRYKHKDVWNRKRALFGQNDYIDILGDGSIKPVDLVRGPDWLIGFKGNELQRLTRRVKFHGERLRLLYPAKYHNIQKRIFFLYKKYNKRRGKRVTGQ